MLIRRNSGNDKGFRGATKTTTKLPFKSVGKSADMYPYGNRSNFITPKTSEGIQKNSNGIKR